MLIFDCNYIYSLVFVCWLFSLLLNVANKITDESTSKPKVGICIAEQGATSVESLGKGGHKPWKIKNNWLGFRMFRIQSQPRAGQLRRVWAAERSGNWNRSPKSKKDHKGQCFAWKGEWCSSHASGSLRRRKSYKKLKAYAPKYLSAPLVWWWRDTFGEQTTTKIPCSWSFPTHNNALYQQADWLKLVHSFFTLREFFCCSGFFPVIINFLRRVPVIGSLLNLPVINKVGAILRHCCLYIASLL